VYLVQWGDSRLVFGCVCTHHSPPIIIRKHTRRFSFITHPLFSASHKAFKTSTLRDRPSPRAPAEPNRRRRALARWRRHISRVRIMSDSEHEVETFESADAGASHTVPMQAGSVRKGGFMVRSRRPARDATASAEGGFVFGRDARDARGDARARWNDGTIFVRSRGVAVTRRTRSRARGDGRARGGGPRGETLEISGSELGD